MTVDPYDFATDPIGAVIDFCAQWVDERRGEILALWAATIAASSGAADELEFYGEAVQWPDTDTAEPKSSPASSC